MRRVGKFDDFDLGKARGAFEILCDCVGEIFFFDFADCDNIDFHLIIPHAKLNAVAQIPTATVSINGTSL